MAIVKVKAHCKKNAHSRKTHSVRAHTRKVTKHHKKSYAHKKSSHLKKRRRVKY